MPLDPMPSGPGAAPRFGLRAAMRLATLGLLTACLVVSTVHAQEKVPVPGTDRYRIRYADGSTTLNDWCPVGNRALGRTQTPVYVNGTPVGFC